MKSFTILLPILLLRIGGEERVGASGQEVPEINITNTVSHYRDFAFQVGFMQEELRHENFQIYDFVIAITCGNRKNLASVGYIEVWDDSQFVCSSSVQHADESSLPLSLKKKVETKNALLFFFRMNPHYVKESRFTYQVLRDDGSVEMNCLLRVKDFVNMKDRGCETGT
jgi:hypothetical protein